MLNEADMITRLKTEFPDHIGDDAAVIEYGDEQSYLLTKDLVVEDVHFRLSYSDPALLAHKALHVNLSDIAAMGAQPQYALLGISLPLTRQSYANSFLESFAIACKQAGVMLIGGDTTRSPDKLFISVTLIGGAKTTQIKYRHTAMPGDWVCIAGNLGHAHLGLVALEQSLNGYEQYKSALLQPTAKISEGLWLAEHSAVTAMMDISDGLYIDLKRLCNASRTQGNINLDCLEPTQEFIRACRSVALDSTQVMLTGGEDYNLLFTATPSSYPSLATQFYTEFGYRITWIGSLSHGTGINFTQHGMQRNLQLKSFSHFGEPL